MNDGLLRFEGVIGYAASDRESAAHFFEHTLGLTAAAEEGPLRFYPLNERLSIAVDISGDADGDPPYMLFSTTRLTEAGEHFLSRGCEIRRVPWAPGADAFIARSPDGYAVCVVDEASLADGEGGSS
ncbi:MAG: hypothetical protein EPO22_09230 [Dehalococcoidia bacterium]|nr:MAG: hypothetical protein EPO22_09230 [Dehalococcoidia bacterium]